MRRVRKLEKDEMAEMVKSILDKAYHESGLSPVIQRLTKNEYAMLVALICNAIKRHHRRACETCKK